MSAGEAQGSPVNRLPYDSTIRTGRPSRIDQEIAGDPRQPGDPAVEELDVQRRAGTVQIGRVESCETRSDRRQPGHPAGAAASRASSAAASSDAYWTPERPSTK